MAMRIVALLIVLALGGYVWVTKNEAENPAPPEKVDQTDTFLDPDIDSKSQDPGVPPDLRVDVDLVQEGTRASLEFTVTEAHGWYVDHIYVEFWYVEKDENGEFKKVGDSVPYMFHRYLPFGQTLKERTTILDLEFPNVKDKGTTENWRASIKDYKKVRAPKK